MIDAFLAGGGTLAPTTALVTGYDFLIGWRAGHQRYAWLAGAAAHDADQG